MVTMVEKEGGVWSAVREGEGRSFEDTYLGTLSFDQRLGSCKFRCNRHFLFFIILFFRCFVTNVEEGGIWCTLGLGVGWVWDRTQTCVAVAIAVFRQAVKVRST